MTAVVPFQPKIVKPTLDDFFLKMILYGKQGQGKTTLAVTAQSHEKLAPILVISFDKGDLAYATAGNDPFLAGLGINEVPDTINIEPETNEETGEPGGTAYLHEIFKWLAKGDHSYRTIVFDQITKLEHISLMEVVNATGSYTKAALKSKSNLDPDKFIDGRDYQKNNDRMKRILQMFRDLPLNVILLAQEREFTEGQWPNDVKLKGIGPALSPSLKEELLALYQVVARISLVEKFVPDEGQDLAELRKRQEKPKGKSVYVTRLLTRPEPITGYNNVFYEAKDRSPGGRIGKIVENPTMGYIYDRITGKEVNA